MKAASNRLAMALVWSCYVKIGPHVIANHVDQRKQRDGQDAQLLQPLKAQFGSGKQRIAVTAAMLLSCRRCAVILARTLLGVLRARRGMAMRLRLQVVVGDGKTFLSGSAPPTYSRMMLPQSASGRYQLKARAESVLTLYAARIGEAMPRRPRRAATPIHPAPA